MKSTRTLTILLLVAVCAFGWLQFVSGLGAASAQQREMLQQAEDLRQKGLYQLALEKGQEAAALEKSTAAYDFLVATAQEYYAQAPQEALAPLRETYQAACAAFPEQAAYWEGYADLYIQKEDYAEAGAILRRARNYHAQSDRLAAQWQSAYYAYDTQYQSYLEMSLQEVAGMYTVQTTEGWGVSDATGEEVVRNVCSYVGPVSAEGYLLLVTPEGETQILDKDGVMHGRFQGAVTAARGFQEGLVAVRLEGREDWCFVDEVGQERFGGFLQAGMFQNGRAAVQLADGQWCLIDAEGAPRDDTRWDEVLLAENGAFLHDGRMMVRKGDSWTMCDITGEVKGTVACQQMDICLGEDIAFCQGGKWGFMDRSGEVTIQPAYDGAHSFSGGVAAVCQDGLWGFIDEEGTLVVPYTFAEAGYFDADSGCCRVRLQEGEDCRLIEWQVER